MAPHTCKPGMLRVIGSTYTATSVGAWFPPSIYSARVMRLCSYEHHERAARGTPGPGSAVSGLPDSRFNSTVGLPHTKNSGAGLGRSRQPNSDVK